MKKVRLLAFVLAIVTVFVSSMPILAEENEPAEVDYDLSYTLEANTSFVKTGDTVDVKVSFDANAGITAAVSTIKYNTEQLSYVGWSFENSIIPKAYLSVNAKKDWVKVTVGGDITMNKADPVVFDKLGLVVTLTFKVSEEITEDTDITMSLTVVRNNVVNDKGETGEYNNLNGTSLTIKAYNPETHKHCIEIIPGKAPTCTEPGIGEGRRCTNCGKILKFQLGIAALGHDTVVDEAVDPTCTETGLTEGSHCGVCDKVLVAQEVVEALGHDVSDEWDFDTETHWHNCANCDEKFDEADHVLSDDGHCECGYYEPKFIYGDANGDGKINSADIILIKKYVANYDKSTGTSTVEVSLGADANGDGKINSSDIILLKKYIANFDSTTGSSTIVLGPAKEA